MYTSNKKFLLRRILMKCNCLLLLRGRCKKPNCPPARSSIVALLSFPTFDKRVIFKEYELSPRAAELTSLLESRISNFYTNFQVNEIDRVVSVGDGIACVYGLKEIQAGEIVEFSSGALRLEVGILSNATTLRSQSRQGDSRVWCSFEGKGGISKNGTNSRARVQAQGTSLVNFLCAPLLWRTPQGTRVSGGRSAVLVNLKVFARTVWHINRLWERLKEKPITTLMAMALINGEEQIPAPIVPRECIGSSFLERSGNCDDETPCFSLSKSLGRVVLHTSKKFKAPFIEGLEILEGCLLIDTDSMQGKESHYSIQASSGRNSQFGTRYSGMSTAFKLVELEPYANENQEKKEMNLDSHSQGHIYTALFFGFDVWDRSHLAKKVVKPKPYFTENTLLRGSPIRTVNLLSLGPFESSAGRSRKIQRRSNSSLYVNRIGCASPVVNLQDVPEGLDRHSFSITANPCQIYS
ncbi:hypothetical protein M9H77_26395 [Catharanthus roseus]|uniref:Uncharacterized protein n=1 Tax=Catharanthus roseus TaxID=4058 RepID=A0ACC0AC92_CATRO|nr:hypothetical protein M9H77_26395 [Catharanthus roseus]